MKRFKRAVGSSLSAYMLLAVIANAAVRVDDLSLSKNEMDRDGHAVLNVTLVNENTNPETFKLGIYISKEGYTFSPEHEVNPLRQVKEVICPAGEKKVMHIAVYPKLLQVMWGNDRNLAAPGNYTFRVGDVSKGPASRAVNLTVKDVIGNEENAYDASYLTTNPFRDALLPVPETAIFKMPGYALWCPSVINVDGTYHLFCSRWKEGTSWGQSHIIRATSTSLFGPYEFKEIVMEASDFPYSWGRKGLHNPKIVKAEGKYLLHFLAMSGQGGPSKNTGFAVADSIEGPWTVIDHVVLPCSNVALWVHEDGSAYAVGKDNMKIDGKVVRTLKAYRADSYLGPYECVGEGENRLPYHLEHEDPTLWWANHQYNVILTDWMGKVTSEQKSVIYLTSKDGIDYKLFSPIAIWRRSESVPVVNAAGDISDEFLAQIERPEVFLNEEGEVTALLTGVISQAPKGERDQYIMIRPINRFVPENN